MSFLAHLSPLTLATFAALGITVLALWLPPRVWMVGAGITVVLGYASGVLVGAVALWLLLFCLSAHAAQHEREVIRYASVAVVVLLALALGLHIVPGFENPVVLRDARLTPDAVPYTLYLNFDKTFAGLAILGLCYGSLLRTRASWKEALRNSWLIPIVVAVLIGCSWLLGYVHADPKWTAFILAWAPVNLLFTCMSEEAFFRGFIQRRMAALTNAWVALVITSALFGLAHIGGGWTYVLLSTIAGLGYGYVYQRSRSVEMAILTHFAVNATHFLFFTYPAAT